jgi:hypothetical protein
MAGVDFPRVVRRRQHDDRDLPQSSVLLDLPKDLDAVYLGNANVQQQQMGDAVFSLTPFASAEQEVQDLLTIREAQHLVSDARPPQVLLDQPRVPIIVFDDQDDHFLFHRRAFLVVTIKRALAFRQRHVKLAAFVHFRFHPNLAAVAIQNPPDDGQAQSVTGPAPRVETGVSRKQCNKPLCTG